MPWAKLPLYVRRKLQNCDGSKQEGHQISCLYSTRPKEDENPEAALAVCSIFSRLETHK